MPVSKGARSHRSAVRPRLSHKHADQRKRAGGNQTKRTDDEKSQEDRDLLFAGLRNYQRSRCTLSIKTCHGPPLRSRLKCFSRCRLTRADDFCASGARHAIDLAAYALTDWPVMQAFTRAADPGVKVRIYLDGTRLAERAPTQVFRDLAETPGVEIRTKHKFVAPMHLKSYQIDGRLLSVMAPQTRDGLEALGCFSFDAMPPSIDNRGIEEGARLGGSAGAF